MKLKLLWGLLVCSFQGLFIFICWFIYIQNYDFIVFCLTLITKLLRPDRQSYQDSVCAQTLYVLLYSFNVKKHIFHQNLAAPLHCTKIITKCNFQPSQSCPHHNVGCYYWIRANCNQLNWSNKNRHLSKLFMGLFASPYYR